MKTQFIDTLSAGDAVDDVFLLSEKRLAQKRDGSPYLTLSLSDRTGVVKGVMWEPDTAITAHLKAGDPLRVRGSVSEYRGTVQLVIRSLEKLETDAADPADFLPATSMDVDALFDRLKRMTASMETEWIRLFFERLWSDPTVVHRFKRAPAAKLMHHAYLGGLLVHCLSMAVLAEKIASHYSGIDRDLLVAGTILHDIGKLEEFEYDSHLEYSTRGRLLNHIVIGLEMIDATLREVGNVPRDQADLLRHMVISHHGEREFGALEPPKTLEAVLLHFIDEMDSKVNAIREFIGKSDPSEPWTAYHRLLERHFLMPRSDDADEPLTANE
jgi:3'-5' exoribonuclease